MVRQISNGNEKLPGMTVGLVDERGELAGCYQGVPQNDVGMRTDVLDGCPHADFAPGQTPVRGVWQVLPVEHLDHLAAIGGVMNNGVVRTRLFFRRVMALLDAAAAADANS